MEPLIRFVSIERRFGKKTVLSNIDWEMPSVCGLTAVVGRSGSGKTTFLNLLGLLDTPDSGDVQILGSSLNYSDRTTVESVRRAYFGFVFQNFCLIDGLTILDNVMMPLLYRGVLKGKARDQAMYALAQVGLEDRSEERPSILSGGEKQRVAIARAVASEPRIVLADEPTGNLDEENSKIVLDIFRDLAKKEIATVLVTHDAEVAKSCNHCYHVKGGGIEII